jgi:citrate/tricarballylate utilization protein
MPSLELIQEIDRQLTVCNACRYCEGYCAVFPAMELRRTFDEEDIVHLANLCFDCRACYNACPYTPPHDYAINIPAVMSQARVETYREFSAPRLLSRLFGGNTFLVGLTVAIAVLLTFGSVLVIQGEDILFKADGSEGSFYRIIPYYAMVLPALVLSFYWIGILALGAVRFWHSTGHKTAHMLDMRSFLQASKDAFGLEYLKGGGDGCDYPRDEKSNARAVMHHFVVWGVVLDLVSTTVAAINHNFLGMDPPYDYLSIPVVTGFIGGVMITIGGIGLLWLKRQARDALASEQMLKLDYAVLLLLIVTAVTGLVLMLLRSSAASGTLLTVHLGVIAALYLSLPYSKFAHVVYRYAALVRHHIEMAHEQPKSAGH